MYTEPKKDGKALQQNPMEPEYWTLVYKCHPMRDIKQVFTSMRGPELNQAVRYLKV